MKITLAATKNRITARHNNNTIGSCLYSGNVGYSAARRTVIEQIKSQFATFELVEVGEVETMTTRYEDGQAVEETWA